jgi:hypothetical protein
MDGHRTSQVLKSMYFLNPYTHTYSYDRGLPETGKYLDNSKGNTMVWNSPVTLVTTMKKEYSRY